MTRRWFYGPVQDPKYDVTPKYGAREGVEKTSGSNLSDYSNWIHTRKDSVGKHLNLLFDAKKSQPSMEEKTPLASENVMLTLCHLKTRSAIKESNSKA